MAEMPNKSLEAINNFFECIGAEVPYMFDWTLEGDSNLDDYLIMLGAVLGERVVIQNTQPSFWAG